MRSIPVLIALLLPSGAAFALALSDVTLDSALGEPLNARVNVLAATGAELGSLTLVASTVPDMAQASIPLKCELHHDKNGDYITITSKDPIREPYLKLLLEVDWTGGKIARDYSLLFDPR